MSGLDERIRREMQDATRPVRIDGVLEHVSRKRVRRKLIRRVELVALSVAVVAGTVMSVVGLTRVFGDRDVRTPGSQPGSGSPTVGEEVRLCDETQLRADLDGDGTLDEVAVYSPSTTSSCDSPEVGQRYVLQVSGGKWADHKGPDVNFYGVDRDLTECEEPFNCKLFAAPDLNGDGAHELAIRVPGGAPVTVIFYRLLRESDDTYSIQRVRMGASTVRDDSVSDDAAFAWQGTSENPSALECREDGPDRVLVASSGIRSKDDPGHFDVHEVQISYGDGLLRVVASADYPDMSPDDNPPFVRPDTFCGAQNLR